MARQSLYLRMALLQKSKPLVTGRSLNGAAVSSVDI
jgi:hypothetical protein